MTVADDLVGLYRTREARLTAAAVLRLRPAWAVGFNPDDPVTTLTAVGRAGAVLTRACQVAAETETRLWLTALLAGAAGVGPADIDPVAFPDLAGTSAQGVPVGAVTGQAPAVYLARVGAGAGRENAARSAQAWLDNIAVSETYRVANHGTLATAGTDPRFSGRVIRITRPGACQFCQLIHDRGYLPAHAGFAAHRNCRCTPSPESSSYATSRAAVRRGIRAAQAGGSKTARTAEEREMVAARERARRYRQQRQSAGGSGGRGRRGGRGGEGGGQPGRVLLTDKTATFGVDWGSVPWHRPSRTPPPSFETLRREPNVRFADSSDPWKYLTDKREEDLPRWLRQQGIEIVSIGAVGRVTEGLKLPDVLIVGTEITVELKKPRARDGIERAMEEAAEQSRRLVLDVRDLNVSYDQAMREVRSGVSRYDEVLVRGLHPSGPDRGKEFGLLWPWP